MAATLSGSANPISRFTQRRWLNWKVCWTNPRVFLRLVTGRKPTFQARKGAGIDALFITGGLAGAVQTLDTAEEIAAVLTAENTTAMAAMRHLVW